MPESRPYAERRATRVVFPAPGAERAWGIVFLVIGFVITSWLGWMTSGMIDLKVRVIGAGKCVALAGAGETE